MKTLLITLFCFIISQFLMIFSSFSQETEKIVIVGKFSWLEWKERAGWADFNAPEYIINTLKADSISYYYQNNNIKFIIFSGSWCGDSKTEVPKMFKLFETAIIPADSISLYGLDREKQESSGTALKYQIQRVPTLIILINNKEAGRIIEFPRPNYTWEDEILEILKKYITIGQ